jgi:hypothetical protein
MLIKMDKVQNILKLDKSDEAAAFANNVLAADAVKLPLTQKQNAVIFCLQQGCCLITSDQYKGAWVAGNKGQYHINNGLFWRLVQMGLIKQSTWESKNFDYILTALGKKVITKKFDLETIM